MVLCFYLTAEGEGKLILLNEKKKQEDVADQSSLHRMVLEMLSFPYPDENPLKNLLSIALLLLQNSPPASFFLQGDLRYAFDFLK